MDPIDAFRRAERHGLCTWRQLRSQGTSSLAVSHAVRSGQLRRVHRGVYAAGDLEARQRALAVMRAGAVVSHTTAAALWGFDLVRAERAEATWPRNWNGVRPPGVRIHRADQVEVELFDGVRLTSRLRTLVDCARVLPLEEAVAVMDSALRQGAVTVEGLATAARSASGPGSAKVRHAVSLADGRAESVLESVLRVVLRLAGVSAEPQVVIRVRGEFVARVDLLVDGWLVLEADGFAYHSATGDFRRERRAHNALVLAGYRVLRFTWHDVLTSPDYVVATVRTAVAAAA
jgi:very-short-patch-repair endonuclease